MINVFIKISHSLFQMAAQPVTWSWVDFELGENVTNAALDAKWSQAVIDGRKHVSHFETTKSHAPQFILAIEYYRIIDCMTAAVYKGVKPLCRLDENIIRYGFYDIILWCLRYNPMISLQTHR